MSDCLGLIYGKHVCMIQQSTIFHCSADLGGYRLGWFIHGVSRHNKCLYRATISVCTAYYQLNQLPNCSVLLLCRA